MSVFLVIRTLDVDYRAQAATTVRVGFDAPATIPVSATAIPGTNEIEITPASISRISLQVKQQGFFDIDQGLILNVGPPPTLSFDGVQAINVRNLDAHTRGSDFNVEVFVVLGQLRDALANVNTIASSAGINLGLVANDVPHFATPILNSAGIGFSRLNQTISAVTPVGSLFFAERITAPKLIAIYRPARFATHPVIDPQNHPINYHLFFHPFIPPSFSRNYPFHPHYVDLIARYLLNPLLNLGIIDPGNKQMVHQHERVGEKAIFIFPVGSPTEQMGTLSTQSAAHHLLQEVGFWVQRMDGVPFPLQPTGQLAMSCFSAGVRFLAAILMGARKPIFHDQVLREVYAFDPVFDGSREETFRFNRAVLAWWRRGVLTRSFRVYAQNRSYMDDLGGSVSGAVITRGPAGSVESEGARSTILLVPTSFWRSIDSRFNFGFVHQLIPALFMEHAMALNAF